MPLFLEEAQGLWSWYGPSMFARAATETVSVPGGSHLLAVCSCVGSSHEGEKSSLEFRASSC
jgi:hypothetical protein